MLYGDLSTEEKIERAVERQTDRVDREYMSGQVETVEYKRRLAELHDAAEAAYRAIPRKSWGAPMFSTKSLLDACVSARKLNLRPLAVQVALAARRAERYGRFGGQKARDRFTSDLLDRYLDD